MQKSVKFLIIFFVIEAITLCIAIFAIPIPGACASEHPNEKNCFTSPIPTDMIVTASNSSSITPLSLSPTDSIDPTISLSPTIEPVTPTLTQPPTITLTEVPLRHEEAPASGRR